MRQVEDEGKAQSWIIVSTAGYDPSEGLIPGLLGELLIGQSQRTAKKYLLKEKNNWKLPDDTPCQEGHYCLFVQYEEFPLGRAPIITFETTLAPPSLICPTSVKAQDSATSLQQALGKEDEDEDAEDQDEEVEVEAASIPTTQPSGKGKKSRVRDDLWNFLT